MADDRHVVGRRQPRRPPSQDLFEAAAPLVHRAQLGAYDGDPHLRNRMAFPDHTPTPDPSHSSHSDRAGPDPILVRRAQIARWTERGQRAGYGLFGVAILGFVFGAVAGFTGVIEGLVIACLALGTLTLAPAIVFGYAVKAAAREDRERGLSG
jgi:hypothetical protein